MKPFFAMFFVVILSITAVSALHFVFASDNTVLTNKGLPTPSLGVNGDFYVDSATGKYYLKSNGNWIPSNPSAALGVLKQVPTLKTTNSKSNSSINSQGGILTNSPSTNFVQPSTVYCFQGTMSVQGFCVDTQGHVLYSPHSTLQSNAGGNTLCSTGLKNSKGYCINGMNSQGGILGMSNYVKSNTHFCSTGLVNARGLCMNNINSENIFPPTHSTSPSFSSSQNFYNAPYNTQGSFGSPDVTRSQIFTIPGVNSPSTQNLMNSQGGLYGHN